MKDKKLGPFKALIFDQDGTLLDAEAMHLQSWVVVAKKHGVSFTENNFCDFAGKGDLSIANYVKKKGNLELSPDELREEKRNYYKKHLDDIGLTTGALNILKQGKNARIPMALATISPREETMSAVKRLGMDKYLTVIVDKDFVGDDRIKPNPDIYLAAAKQLGVQPQNCCVFEDSLTGVEAAKAAGMTCIAVPTKYSKHFDYSKADLVIETLSRIKIEYNTVYIKK